MEQSAAVFSINNHGQIDFSTNVYSEEPQPYQYDFWGGLTYIINVSQPIGNRIRKISFQGEPLITKRYYKVVFNSYRLTGCDFPLLKRRKVLYETVSITPFLLREFQVIL